MQLVLHAPKILILSRERFELSTFSAFPSVRTCKTDALTNCANRTQHPVHTIQLINSGGKKSVEIFLGIRFHS